MLIDYVSQCAFFYNATFISLMTRFRNNRTDMKNHIGLNTLIMTDMHLDTHQQLLGKTKIFFCFQVYLIYFNPLQV